MKTLKFKFYQHKRNRYLKLTINAAGVIYNHCVALHKRYYRMWGKHLNCAKLQKHIAKLRKSNKFWQLVGSQAVQDICQRIEKAYQLFFKHNKKGVRPPNFKKVKKYKSFTLKQAGYKFLGGNRIKIGNKVYQFWNSQPIEGKVKTVTIKRTPLGEMFLVVVVDNDDKPSVKSETGKIAGFDFGIKTFLTCSEGFSIQSPQFLKQALNDVKKASRSLSKKRKGSNNWEKARKCLVRQHEQVVNRRRDWFWKLAHRLTEQFDVLCFETLNLKGMQRLWGRKIGDLAFGEFIEILEWVAVKKGKLIVFIDQWYPSSKTCFHCGHVLEKLELNVREWRCPSCSNVNGRDENASLNIKRVGASTLRLDGVRQGFPATVV
ncbi:transposase [Limnoraphis robusta Tam1]|uniref:Transposase n=1 Tax=Limnoraphis robusta CCNP1315 TaxID=3110306 RepID=A0ABU5U7J9_9CYAN|nr:transposase [Limnoraphis robusta]MEA5499234.1 transposase [Limnoraphis robusta BA-68 BA1]MEA5522975.1 transposase [Limnoraphis robusta CCNP1315]MEA5540648.1 transposase [Limnoraphis robusta Tam1]MEA5545018.1 transposase [Limnoraphis robusta CCNP1324]